jgi:hypothetical protein
VVGFCECSNKPLGAIKCKNNIILVDGGFIVSPEVR